MPGRAKSVKRFERSNVLDTALYKKYLPLYIHIYIYTYIHIHLIYICDGYPASHGFPIMHQVHAICTQFKIAIT